MEKDVKQTVENEEELPAEREAFVQSSLEITEEEWKAFMISLAF